MAHIPTLSIEIARLCGIKIVIPKQIKQIAIIGLGSIGKRHLRLVKEIRPDIRIILVRSGKGASWPEERLADVTVNTLSEAISNGIDAAIVSTPAVFHVSQSMELIKSGIPTLIEKPLSHELSSAEKLRQIWLKEKTLILLGYTLRHAAATDFFYNKIKKDDLGTILSVTIRCESYLPNWRPDQDYRKTVSAKQNLGGGVLLELSHEIDYANWIFGPFKSVRSMLKNSETLDIDVEDMADIIFETHDKKTVNIHLDFCSQIPSRFCLVNTDKGRLKWDFLKGVILWTDIDGRSESWDFSEERDEIYKNQLKHFFCCIEEECKEKVTINDGVSVLKLIASIQRASNGVCI